MGTRVPLASLGLLAAGCGDWGPRPSAIIAPSFEIATERLVIEGPFSFRDRVGSDFQPFDLNDRGDVVGSVPGVGSGILPGDGGALQPLPPIFVDGALAPAGLTAINQLGVAAGSVTDFFGGAGRARPLLWSPGGAPEIGPYLPGAAGGDAVVISVLDVNASGVVVGSYGDAPFPQRPWRWAPGAASAELLETSTATDGRAGAINSAGIIVGDLGGATLPVPGFNGAIWAADGGLTFLPGSDFLRDINESGQIAGRTSAFCPTLWDADFTINWQAPCGPTFQATALAVNDLGHFLYSGATDADPALGSRLRVEGAEPATLPPWPGAAVTIAIMLNNRGTIVGLAGPADLSSIEPLVWTYRVEPIPPDELVQDLVDAVDAAEADGTLSHGDANALRAKLEAASRHLAAGRCTPAGNLLEAFVRQVDALERSGRLAAAEAEDLRNAANAAIAEIAATCGTS